VPREIVDLGAVITEETPARFWGRGFLETMGYTDQNRFDVIEWAYGPVSGSNSYYRLFNHGGPHVDAPNHIGVGSGLDAWPVVVI
jgi:kynurenine formamidase